jgi:glucose-6-phosphate 1-dehydrogenase
MKQNVSTAIVIFGASGDLTKRKLIPALFQLAQDKLLPNSFHIVGFARREFSHEQFRAEMSEALLKFARTKPAKDSTELKEFIQKLYYHSASYDDSKGFATLKALLDQLDEQAGAKPDSSNRLFYLSTPPNVFAEIMKMLGGAELIGDPYEKEYWTRVIIEKPFGRDLESAHTLNKQIRAVLDENQTYRIDHYLGKETVQNIMAFRFGNSIFEPLWNRRYVDHVQITVAEAVSVEGRGGYYDQSGVLRDMVQNHILQLLALVAMEPPASFAPNAVRNEKVKVLSALRPIKIEEIGQYTIRGQYSTGTINGRKIPDYLSEPGVDPNSITETFVALKAYIDNWRWAGVPFYIRSGKALPKRITEITIEFRQPPLALFSHANHEGHQEGDHRQPNVLSLRVQPNEGIRLTFGLKVPGPSMVLQSTNMEFSYANLFDAEPPEAYERLILDAILGDSTLFIRHDEVEAAWTFVDGILEGWASKHKPPIYPYRSGTWGPHAADEFMAKDGRKWAEL